MPSSAAQVITKRFLALRTDVDSELDGEPGVYAGVNAVTDVTDQALKQGGKKTPLSLVANTGAVLEDFLEDTEIALDEKHEELDNVLEDIEIGFDEKYEELENAVTGTSH